MHWWQTVWGVDVWQGEEGEVGVGEEEEATSAIASIARSENTVEKDNTQHQEQQVIRKQIQLGVGTNQETTTPPCPPTIVDVLRGEEIQR
mgnify:CR=1 FL=1